MTINPAYAELLGREIQRDRLREAEKERLIRLVATKKTSKKVMPIPSFNWKVFWSRMFRKRAYISISKIPKKSPSI